MSICAKLGFVFLWVISLLTVATLVRGQVIQTVPLPTPEVISGADFGFRVEGTQGVTPVGRLVIRKNGEWVEAKLGSATAKIAR
jgi:hypothetical protein